MIRGLQVAGLFVVLVCSLSSPCRADLVVYGDLEGSNVLFNGVMEISNDPLPLYGPPTTSNNTLEFVAPGFMAQSQSGGVEFLNGRVRFTVEAKPGFLIDSMLVEGFGSYFAFGGNSQVFVGATPFVQIGNDLFPGSFSFDASGNSNGPWADSLVINFPASEQITFVMDNSLFTIADANGAAFISDQGIQISALVSAVPEPRAAVLVLIGSFVGFICWQRACRLPVTSLRHT